MTIKKIPGGITAPKGFKASSLYTGIKEGSDPSKPDMALILADNECCAAGVYTTNKVTAAPVTLTKKHLENGKARAIIVNSGNANACCKNAMEIAEKACQLVATSAGISKEDVGVASTGVIGKPLSITPFEEGVPKLFSTLCDSEKASDLAAKAIMTTDTRKKEIALEFLIDGKTCHIGGIAKGSGMICPNMATLLCFITTDVNISPKMLEKALKEVNEETFNLINVDNDTSTNDTVIILASGMANNKLIEYDDYDYSEFFAALLIVMDYLSKEIARDGEGATKLLICTVKNAPCKKSASAAAKAVISSSLVKTALFASDANWGRILCALGYSDADFQVDKIDITLKSSLGEIQVCKNSLSVSFSEEEAKKILSEPEIEIIVNLNAGEHLSQAYGCDLTYDYIKINAEYRT